MRSVIIIGGGLGGLTTGALLAKEGLRVTVIEKNAIIGGGLQSFERFGEIFDTGMHIIGGMHKDGNIRRICEYLGIWDRVHVKDTDPENIDTIYFAEDKQTYRIAQGRNKFVKSLSRSFPDQKENLIAYVDAMYRIADEVELFHLKPSDDYLKVHSDEFQMSANGFIAKYVTDEHLKSVLAYLNPLYGGRGDITPAYVHSLISVMYIDGSSRFAGGSILFAETLRDFIERNGGRVIAGEAVTAVHSEEKNITGVTISSGMTFSAECYICAIHPCSFFPLLDNPKILPKPFRTRLNELPNSYSAFTLNIKLKPGTFKFFNYTMYYMSRYDAIWKFGDTDKWPCGFLYITPPEINQGEYANKIIVTAPMQWKFVERWADTTIGQRCADYEEWKMKCTETLLDCMEEIQPGFKDCIEAVNSASPLTIRDFYGVKEGAMCGFSKDCNNLVVSQVPVVTKVPNLFLTGQNCNLHGFCGVSLTAINTCEAILGRNYILNKINKFDDIRPYYEFEIPPAMRRIAGHPLFEKAVRYLFPEQTPAEWREKVSCIDTTYEFQHRIMYSVIDTIVKKTCSEFVADGFENLDSDKKYLFVSNHRDIMLDASLLSYALVGHGFDTPEITFGANLMQGDFVIDFGKSNKMFRVERPGGDVREFVRLSKHLSEYIRMTLLQKGQSVWIAQRNGRTKDGKDRTDQGIVKMFSMSGPKNDVSSIAALNIVPVAVSYEWEPCDILKAEEQFKRSIGPYQKKSGEDLNSILTGVMQKKGRVHLTVCAPLTEEELRSLEPASSNDFFKNVSSLIDGRILGAYQLYPNNYIACDLLGGTDEHSGHYSDEQKVSFEKHLSEAVTDGEASGCDGESIRKLILDIYANPVSSKRELWIKDVIK